MGSSPSVTGPQASRSQSPRRDPVHRQSFSKRAGLVAVYLTVC